MVGISHAGYSHQASERMLKYLHCTDYKGIPIILDPTYSYSFLIVFYHHDTFKLTDSHTSLQELKAY